MSSADRRRGVRSVTATYRVQLHADFGFDSAAAAVPYLAALGVSHLYLSPILTAVPGSRHGYDVVDHTTVNPELGGRPALERLAASCHAHQMGLIADIVPNHMALVAPLWRNEPIWHTLTHGPSARFASWFDVDWQRLGGRFGLPILGAADELDQLVLDVGRPDEGIAAGRPVVRYHDHVLPLRPDGPDTADLAELLAAQHWLLASHTEAAQVLNYRRFFEVDQLVAVRVEQPEVFAATHRLLLELHHVGVLDGFRVDHPDGLADPEGYLAQLTAACRPETPIWVEKILEGRERLPSWACSGTTGYDAAAAISAALVDPATADAVSAAWPEPSLTRCVEASKRQVLDQLLQPELTRLDAAATAALPALPPEALRDAIRELLVQLHVYRAYVRPGTPPDPTLVGPLRDALRRVNPSRPARREDPAASPQPPGLGETAAALVGVLERPETAPGDAAAARDLCVRFQQTTGPVMAKGIEDTAFYRWHRLVALNEVGADPACGERPSVGELHSWAAHQAEVWPSGLTTLSTHDTKRSEAVRARLIALAGDADAWTAISELAVQAAVRHGVDAAAAHLVWQTVAGCPGLDAVRLDGYLMKALREGKQRTSWLEPDADYEGRVQALGLEMLAGGPVGDAIRAAGVTGAEAIRGVTLAQKLLQLTLPGVPDTYQGDCGLSYTLVDPDNRRGVDFASAAERLAQLDAAGLPRRADLDDEIRWVTSRTLRLRARRPELFASDYRPLDLGAPLLAFGRGPELVTVVHRLPRQPVPAEVPLPAGEWRDELTGRRHRDGGTGLFADLPVALLLRSG